MRRSDLILVTAVLGVLTVLVLTIGRGLAIIALISIIGIPIYFLLAAIPPLFVLFLLALGFALVLERLGTRSILAAFALAAATLVSLPALVNRITEHNIARLIAGDRTGPIEPWRGGTLAIFVRPSHTDECGDFCQRALSSGAVKRFIVARSAQTWPEADLAARGASYRLERRDQCDAAKLRDGLREIPVLPNAPPAAPVLRLEIARGNCLLAATAPVSEADGVLMYSPLREGGSYGGEMNPFVVPQSGTRLTFFAKGASGLAEVWRQTSVRYSTLYPVLVLGFIHRYGLELDAGFWREPKTAGVAGTAPDIDGLLKQTLGMRLDPPMPDIGAERDKALADALQRPGSFGVVNQTLVEDMFEALDKGRDAPAPEAIQRALALLKEPRVAVPQHLSNLVRVAFRAGDGSRDAVTAAIFGRLDAEVNATPAERTDVEPRERNLRHLAYAVQAIPDRDFARHWARLRVVTEKMETAAAFEAEIRRGRLVGDAAARDLLALIDLQQTARATISRQDTRRRVLYAALSGLCGMGHDAAALLPDLELRLRNGVIVSQYPKDWSAMANTLAALGGDPTLLREVVSPDRIKPHLVRDFEEAMTRAASKPICGFKD
jgi:hypothetical protein